LSQPNPFAVVLRIVPAYIVSRIVLPVGYNSTIYGLANNKTALPSFPLRQCGGLVRIGLPVFLNQHPSLGRSDVGIEIRCAQLPSSDSRSLILPPVKQAISFANRLGFDPRDPVNPLPILTTPAVHVPVSPPMIRDGRISRVPFRPWLLLPRPSPTRGSLNADAYAPRSNRVCRWD